MTTVATTTSTMPTMPMTTSGPAPDVTEGTTEGASPVMLPATYRFDCLDVIEMGDSNMDGQADGDAFQAVLLESTWQVDIEELRLNILLTVQSRDPATDMVRCPRNGFEAILLGCSARAGGSVWW